MRTWKDVATLTKTRSLNGRFVARPAADLPFALEVGTEVAFVPPQTDMPRRGVVDFARDIDGSVYEVGFDSVTDEACARALVGCHCLVRIEDIDVALYEDGPATWVGWKVIEADGGLVGEVASLIENPGQALLEVNRENANTAYIPVVDEFICDVDVENREIVVDLPAGLLDL